MLRNSTLTCFSFKSHFTYIYVHDWGVIGSEDGTKKPYTLLEELLSETKISQLPGETLEPCWPVSPATLSWTTREWQDLPKTQPFLWQLRANFAEDTKIWRGEDSRTILHIRTLWSNDQENDINVFFLVYWLRSLNYIETCTGAWWAFICSIVLGVPRNTYVARRSSLLNLDLDLMAANLNVYLWYSAASAMFWSTGHSWRCTLNYLHQKELINVTITITCAKDYVWRAFLGTLIEKMPDSFSPENSLSKIRERLCESFRCYNNLEYHFLPRDRSVYQVC